jgi:hypothetical protein
MKTLRTSSPRSYFLVAASLLAISTAVPAADMNDCRALEDAAARLACYDSLNAPAAAAAPVEVAPTTAPPAPVEPPTPASVPVVDVAPATDEVAVMDDSVGRERIATDEEKYSLAVTGHVNSCREDSGGQHRFYFENGQIWKQKDNKRIPWRECDFDVTISKDFFGYKMSPTTEKRTIRISRIK